MTQLKAEMNGLLYKSGYEDACDYVTSENLVPELGHAARALEIKHVNELGVYAKVPRSHQIAGGVGIIGVRWLMTTKVMPLMSIIGPDRWGENCMSDATLRCMHRPRRWRPSN